MKSQHNLEIFEASKNFFINEKVEEIAGGINEILKKNSPYGEIHRLPDLVDRFRRVYLAILEEQSIPIRKGIEEAKSRVMEELKTKSYYEKLKSDYTKRFNDLFDKVDRSQNVAALQTIKVETDAVLNRMLNEMHAKDLKIKEDEKSYNSDAAPKPPVKKKRSITLKSSSHATTWHIETEQDLDRYLKELRAVLLKELAPDTILNIEL